MAGLNYAGLEKEKNARNEFHLQEYLNFSTPMYTLRRFKNVIKHLFPVASVSFVREPPIANREYCIKDGDRIELGVVSIAQNSLTFKY